MSQTVSLWGATYSDVPSIVVPSGNSTASFTDVTPTTAAASDVASGKYFFNASGVLTLGTASGGGTGGITQDANGYLVLSDQGGGGSSYTLLAEEEVEISTTSTSTITVTTIPVAGIGNKRSSGDKILFFHIFDKAGMQNGYYYGSLSYCCKVSSYIGTSYYVKSNGTVDYAGITYGVFVSISSDAVTVQARYASSFGTLDGTFVVRVYELDFPDSVSPFA